MVNEEEDTSTDGIIKTALKKEDSGEGNGNPLQYSCLENPMDRAAWQAAVHGIERVRHRLKTREREMPKIASGNREL